MSKFYHLAGAIALWLCSQSAPLHAATALPASPSPHYILDQAKWLNPQEFESLNTKLATYERESSSQIVVAVFPEIPQGEELFDFSQRVFEKWKPGQKNKDNGVILFIFAADRKMRIHTGYGMEGILPDARCQQIISDVVAPPLRQGQRSAAIHAGVDAMIAAAKGEYHGNGAMALENNPSGQGISAIILPLIFVLVVITLIFRNASSKISSGQWYVGGSSSGGGGFSCGGGGFSGGGGGFSGGGGNSGGGGSSGSW